MSVCPKCEGKGFIEYESGVIMVKCAECNGTGEIDDSPKYLIIPEALPGKTLDETADIARKIIKASKDDSISGIGRIDNPAGEPNPSKPKQPSKPKSKKTSRKRAK